MRNGSGQDLASQLTRVANCPQGPSVASDESSGRAPVCDLLKAAWAQAMQELGLCRDASPGKRNSFGSRWLLLNQGPGSAHPLVFQEFRFLGKIPSFLNVSSKKQNNTVLNFAGWPLVAISSIKVLVIQWCQACLWHHGLQPIRSSDRGISQQEWSGLPFPSVLEHWYRETGPKRDISQECEVPMKGWEWPNLTKEMDTKRRGLRQFRSKLIRAWMLGG